MHIQNYCKNVVLALLVMCNAGSSIFAQAPRIPRMPDGKPNLTGLWQAITTADWNVEDHSAQAGPFFQLGATGAIPPGQSIVEGGSIPYKPEALAKNVVEGWQAKDGSYRANGSNITFPDGKKLFLGSSGTGAPFDPEKK